jgi:formate dehydrogenase major subunit
VGTPGFKTDSDIVCLAAAALGRGAQFTDDGADEVWDEIRQVWPARAGMIYQRLDTPGGLQWP